MATGSMDETARIWNVATGQSVSAPFPELGGVRQLRFSPDGKRLATACYRQDPMRANAHLWEVSTGKLLGTMGHRAGLESIEFSQDGRRIATGSRDRTSRVWDGFTGEPISPPLLQAQVLSGRRLDAFAVMTPLDAASLSNAWKKLRAPAQ